MPLRLARVLAVTVLLAVGGSAFAAVDSPASTRPPDGLAVAKSARAAAAEGRFDEAIDTHRRALQLVELQFGPRHEYVAFIVDDLATWQFRRQRYDEALKLSRRAVEIITVAKGESSAETAQLLGNLGSILSGMGRQSDALPIYERSHAIFARVLGPGNPRTAQLARNVGATHLELSQLDQARGRYAEAVKDSMASGSETLETARARLGLATALQRLHAYRDARREAEAAHRRIAAQAAPAPADRAAAAVVLAELDIHESRLDAARVRLEDALRWLPAGDVNAELPRASVLFNLGWVHLLRRQVADAERAYREVLSIYRRRWNPEHPSIGRALHSLAIVYQDLGQFARSEQFYREAVDTFVQAFGAVDASVGATRLEYSSLLTEMGRPEEGLREARAAQNIYAGLPGDWLLKRGYAYAVLALAEHKLGRLDAAEKSYQRAFELIEKVAGPDGSDLAPGLTDVARIQRISNRLSEADRSLARAIAIRERDGALTPSGLAESLSELVRLRLAQGRATQALDVSRRAVEMAVARLNDTSRLRSAAALGEQRQARNLYEQFLETAWTVQPQGPESSLVGEMFNAAQLPHLTGTSDTVSRMAARFAAGEGRLSKLVRERQDAAENLVAIDRFLLEGLSRAPGRTSSPEEETQARAKAMRLTEVVDGLDAQLQKEFPRYAELTNPRPVAPGTVQSHLADDEALFVQVTGDSGSYLFLLTRSAIRAVRTDLNAKELSQAVESVRKGLDLQGVRRLSQLPPFDVSAAHALYRQLFEPFAGELQGVRHLIAVVDRAMQNLPLSVLITKPVTAPIRQASDFQRVSFLGRQLGLSVTPSVGAFVMLREYGARSKARRPFAGFGDPLLEGGQSGNRSSLLAELATEIDPATLRRSLAPLPETREELLAVSRSLKGSEVDLYFGARATETAVRQTDLSNFRYVSFATHGLLAGEFRGLAEPALVLTPPKAATPIDDGLLTASEIATLRLDADWVILSACNTAAPSGETGAEGLSGLARAFFHAGTRALLVSHWWVASDVTTRLIVAVGQAFEADPALGRAEAVRRAMVRLMEDKVDSYLAHPVFWAAFSNVGEGGRGR